MKETISVSDIKRMCKNIIKKHKQEITENEIKKWFHDNYPVEEIDEG